MKPRTPAAPVQRNARRSLTPHEIDLWITVARTVQRFKAAVLPQQAVLPLVAPAGPQPPAKRAKGERFVANASVAVAAFAAPPPPPLHFISPLAPLERKIKRRLMRGSQHVDGVLDLHGMTQADAHGALVHFIHRLHAQGGQLAIVITGKGRQSPQDGYAAGGGILRRHTPDWLRAPDLRHMILGFEEAGAPHGGAGALYVRIRRRAARL